MSSNGSNDTNDRPGDEGLAGSASMEEETSRKRPFKRLAQDVSSNTYSRGNNNIMGLELNRDQMNESIPEGLESIVRSMVSTATQDMQNRMDTIQNKNKERIDSMQTAIDALTKKNQELENTVKDLTLKNEYNEWSYTAEDIPASYWIEHGLVEEESAERNEFISTMKEYTHQLRQGESPKTIELAVVETDLLHDDILLPHWKELTDALMQYQKFNHRED